MKRKWLCSIFLVGFLISPFSKGFCQDLNYKLALSINPAGLLFFGPSLNLGWIKDEKTVLNVHVRRNSWGLLANKIRGKDSTLYSFQGMGYAIGITRFVKGVEQGFYYGAFLSMDIQNTKYAKTSPFAWHEKTRTYGLLINAGKRFKIGSKYFFNVGGAFGAAIINYHWEYDDAAAGMSDPEPRKGNSFSPIGSLELGFGMFLVPKR